MSRPGRVEVVDELDDSQARRADTVPLPAGCHRLRRLSDQLERWLSSDVEKTVATLIDLFEEKRFALFFILLIGVSALPLPTGGATHVFEVVTVLLALQLVAGRDGIWVPRAMAQR